MKRPSWWRGRKDLFKGDVWSPGKADSVLCWRPDLDQASPEIIPVHMRRPRDAAERLEDNWPNSQSSQPPDVRCTAEAGEGDCFAPPLGEPYAEFSGWQASRAEPDLAPVRR